MSFNFYDIIKKLSNNTSVFTIIDISFKNIYLKKKKTKIITFYQVIGKISKTVC